MRAIRTLVVLAVAGLLSVGLVVPAGATGAVNYVALGDSYSSGLGAGPSYTGGSCDRSPAAFSALWSAANNPTSYTSAACAGATTTTVRTQQVAALSSATTLVSVTVGGNDVGFSSIMTTCALHGTSSCVAAVDAAENVATTSLPGQLDAAYGAIRAAAPHATVVVLSYPLFYQLHVWYCIGLSETSRSKIDEGINQVDDVISHAASAYGFRFADVRSAFDGHQLCSGSKWLHAVDLADLAESYHPTAAGQQDAYLPVFSSAAR